MTLRRSIILSVLIHAFIFGSAFAFARLGSGVIWPQEHAVIVSLVSAGLKNSAGTGAGPTGQVSTPHPVQQETVAAPDSQRTVPHEEAVPDIGSPSRVTVEEKDPMQGGKEVGTREGTPGSGTHSSGEATTGLISLEQWALIEASIERNKSYPRLARERAIQGTVRLRFMVDPSGSVEKLEVLKSSGSDILDKASIKSVYRAAPLPYVKGWVEVPIAYVLN